MILIVELCVVIGVLILDLLTKGIAEASLPLGGSVPVIEGVFHFTFTRNDGAAWSILSGQRWFFVVTGLLACIVIVWFLLKSKQNSKVLRIGLSLMLAGTMGNLYDRMVWGSVRDMLDFRLINFPIFNVADSALCIGVILVIVYVLFIYKEAEKKDKTQTDLVADDNAENNPNE